MFKHYFEQVHNVAIWPIISLSIFFVFFVGLILYVWRIRKDHVKHMEGLPLKDDSPGELGELINGHDAKIF